MFSKLLMKGLFQKTTGRLSRDIFSHRNIDQTSQTAMWLAIQGEKGGALKILEELKARHPESKSTRSMYAAVKTQSPQKLKQEAGRLYTDILPKK